MSSMTITATRHPLQTLSMSSTQRGTRRRSARLAFEEEEATPAGKRAKTDTNGLPSAKTAKGTNGVGSAPTRKAKSAYDETDDGFSFSRTRAKKTKAPPKSETIPEESAVTTTTALASSRRKNVSAISSPPPASANNEVASKRRRSARLSGDKEQAPPPEVKQSKRTKKAPERQTTPKASLPTDDSNDDNVGLVGAGDPGLHVQKKRSPTKIALPFADTPIIKRNKEMRKGSGQSHRRSSSSMRGRRASSLIESGGSSAVPHAQVTTDDFYKHIDQTLPEPRRMKQLLTWCGSRALIAKPKGDAKDHNALMAARQIQQELLDDFAAKPEMSDWFNRQDAPPTSIVKKPNPRNDEISERLKDLEIELQRLQEEERAWKSLADSASILPQTNASQSRQKASDDISPALLDDPIQSAILATLTGITLADDAPANFPSTSFPPNTSPSEISSRLTTITKSLEPTIDVFADGVHKLVQYRQTAERAAERVLGAAAQRLESRERDARERSGTAAVGTDDVLRALGGMLNRSENKNTSGER